MPRLKLTETQITRHLSVGQYYSDTIVPRLELYMGKKQPTWFFRTRNTGRHQIGKYPQIGINQARRIATEMGERFDRGEEITPQQIKSGGGQTKAAKVKDAHDDLVAAKTPRWSAGTMRTNLIYWREHIEPKFGQRALSSITTGELTTWLNGYNSLNQRNNLRAYFGQIYRHAIQVEMCIENPAGRLPKSEIIREKKYFSQDDVTKLVGALEQIDAMAAKVILMCLYTGQRPSQTKSIRWDMIDEMPNGDIVMRVPAISTKQRRVVNILLNNPAKTLILRQKQQYGEGEYVFPSPNGGCISKLDKTMHKACAMAGISFLPVGKMRHTFANLLIDKYPIDEVSHYLGHSTVATTQKAYADMTVEKTRGIADGDLF